MREQYRFVWKRAGLTPRSKVYSRLSTAQHYALLFGPEPWRYYTEKGPHELACCNGDECGCGGYTVREQSERKTKDLPKIEWTRIERRDVGPWHPITPPQGQPKEGGNEAV